jgi:hypothetical protein
LISSLPFLEGTEVPEPEVGSLEQLISSVDQSATSISGQAHEREVSNALRGEAAENLLYVVLCAVHEGHNEPGRLYPHLESMFAMRLQRMTISPADIDESVQHGLNEGLLEYTDGKLSLTDRGVSILRDGRLQIMFEGKYLRLFLTRRNVVITSLVVAIISLSLRSGRDRLGASAIMLFMMVSGTLLVYNATEGLLNSSTVDVG